MLLKLLALFTIFIYKTHAEKYLFTNLAEILPKAQFPSYSTEQKILVANQINKMFQVYVSRESKVNNYGVDVLPIFENFLNSTDFDNISDENTVYTPPKPYQCYGAYYPLIFDLIDSNDNINNPIAVVSKFSSFEEVLKIAGPELEKVKLGHVLVSINGLSLKQLFDKYVSTTNGANDYGGLRSVLYFLSNRPGKFFKLTNEDTVVYELKRTLDSKTTFKVKVAVAGRQDNECLEGKEKKTAFSIQKLKSIPSRKRTAPKLNRGIRQLEDASQISFSGGIDNKFFYNPTFDPLVSWNIYHKGSFDMGIIRLASFEPLAETSEDQIVLLIRDLLVNELKDTHAVLFDLRGNPGGYISLADAIPSLFKTPFISNPARTVVSKVNDEIFIGPNNVLLSIEDPSALAYHQTDADSQYSNLFRGQFSSDTTNNKYGVTYTRPIGLLTDGNCYSSCDMFAANMQDYAAATIFGVDGTTGAGGANVVSYADFMYFAPEMFSPLPDDGLDLSIGWRQIVRSGKNEGKLIEDKGILSDFIFRPTIHDFTGNQNRSTIFNRIADQLKVIGLADEISAEPQILGDATEMQPPAFNITFTFLSKLELYNDEVLIETKHLQKIKRKSQITLTDSSLTTSDSGYRKYVIIGYTEDREVVRTNRYIRLLPSLENYLNLKKNNKFTVNFKTITDLSEVSFMKVYNYLSDSTIGLTLIKDSYLALNDGLSYFSQTSSTLSFFVNFEKRSLPKVAFSMDYFFLTGDSVSVGYISKVGGEFKEIYSIFGSEKDVDFVNVNFKSKVLRELSGLSGVEIVFRFNSIWNQNAPIAGNFFLHNFSLSC
ncbi:hypothetical protein HDU92_000730 [Lobulomyces angularis]|nr:hypothetical protein HDU92_000730 [Lobulomyces angularis]